jgi:hypothetical protein
VNALLAALVLAAPFEGELQLQLSSPGATGVVTLSISPRGLRSDAAIDLAKRQMRTTVLVRPAEPEVGLALDPVRKTVQRLSLAQASDALRPQPSTAYRVERLGREKVLSFDCDHVRVSDGAGLDAEYWLSRDVLGDDALAGIVNRLTKQPASLEAALNAAGVGGLALKLQQRTPSGPVRFELTSATSKPVPASAFEVPAGFTQIGGAVTDAATMRELAQLAQLSDEQKRALLERLRDNYERGLAKKQ